MKNLFPADLIRKAKFYFRAVYNDGDCVRIYPTDWQYEIPEYLHSASELENYINQHENFLLDDFNFMEPEELREYGILY